MNAFISPMLQMGGGKKKTKWLFGHHLACLDSNLYKLLFHQLVGEDTVNTGEIPTSLSIAMYEILQICSRTDFSCSMWHSSVADVGLHCKGHHLSLPSHSYCHSPVGRQFHMEQYVSLNLPSMTCNNIEQFNPTNHEISLMFSCLSVRN
jgi:hypothetical protein